jgi:hypothetical protein
VLGTAVGAGGMVVLVWVSLLALLAYLVVLAISIPKLRAHQRAGWQLTYYSMLFFFAYDVINMLAYFGAGALMGFVWNAVGLVAGLYILFQVKDHFKN